MDAWPEFWDHNRPLFERHIGAGFRFVGGKETASFVDKDGNYAAFPVGYITGPLCDYNGSPRPWHVGVYLGVRGWFSWTAATRTEAVSVAREKARAVIAAQPAALQQILV
jgi:hypothetical protein